MDSVINTRICIVCDDRKLLSDFNKKPQNNLQYEPMCKDCQREEMLSGIPEHDSDYVMRQREKDLSSHVADTATLQNTPFPEKEDPNKTTRKLRV